MTDRLSAATRRPILDEHEPLAAWHGVTPAEGPDRARSDGAGPPRGGPAPGRRGTTPTFTRHHGHPLTLDPRVPLCEGAQCWRGAGRHRCEGCGARLCALHRRGRAQGRVLCLPCWAGRYNLYGAPLAAPDAAARPAGAALLPIRERIPGLFFIQLLWGGDPVAVRRGEYDALVRAGDALYVAPATLAVHVVRAGRAVGALRAA